MSAPRTPRTIVFAHDPLSWEAGRRMAVGALVVTALGLVLGFLVNAQTPLPVEDVALGEGAEGRTDGMTALMRAVSTAGHLWVVALAAAAIAPLLRWLTRGWEAAWLLALTLLGSLLITGLIKVVVGRERPLDALVDATSAAFPSGHASRAAALSALAIWAVAVLVRRTGVRVALTVALVGVAVLQGVSRVYLGIHWPSDVLYGLLLGAWWVVVLLKAVEPRVVPVRVDADEPQIAHP
jgi:hypothetical protein